MFLRGLIGLLAIGCVLDASAAPVWTRSTLQAAARECATDNIGSGWCGRGMLALLKSAGMADGLKGGNGQDWEQNLMAAGWRPVKCVNPTLAPLGSVLVYMGDARLGKIPRGTPGGYFGHVEMVALDENGQRLYVSDCPRVRPGGSVPDNFTLRAWVPPGMVAARKPGPATQSDVDTIIQERYKMALAYFDRTKVTATSAKLTTEVDAAEVKR